MLLSRSAEYGIKAILDLAVHGASAISQIAARGGIPQPYAFKLLQRMADAGLVEVQRGRGGGYRLAADPWTTPLRTVVEAIQGDLEIDRCLFSTEGACSASDPCPLHDTWQRLWMDAVNALDGVTIQELARASAARAASPISSPERKSPVASQRR